MQRTLRNRVPGAAAAIAVVTTLASSALIADAQTADASGDEVGAQALPTSYQWESTGPLIGPQPDPTHTSSQPRTPPRSATTTSGSSTRPSGRTAPRPRSASSPSGRPHVEDEAPLTDRPGPKAGTEPRRAYINVIRL
jgi:pyruvate/2-oxoglutarate dehydrogenase complex dihydrolipoamide acyltransferase (E2) component